MEQAMEMTLWALALVGAYVMGSGLVSLNAVLWKMFRRPSAKSNLKRFLNKEKKPSYAIVTGASDGIGKEFAIQLAKTGMNVILMSRSQNKLDAVADEIKSLYPDIKVIVIPFDFSCATKAQYDELRIRFAPYCIDVLVNNVAMNHAFPTPFAEEQDQVIDNIVQVNIHAQLIMTRLVLNPMTERKNGLIINIGSATGAIPCAYLAVYGASKAFLKSWSQALACEVKKQGVHVEHVNTYFVTTNMSKIRKASFTTPTAAQYVGQVLGNVGKSSSSTPYPSHALLDWCVNCLSSILPESVAIDQSAAMHLAIRKRALKKLAKTQ